VPLRMKTRTAGGVPGAFVVARGAVLLGESLADAASLDFAASSSFRVGAEADRGATDPAADGAARDSADTDPTAGGADAGGVDAGGVAVRPIGFAGLACGCFVAAAFSGARSACAHGEPTMSPRQPRPRTARSMASVYFEARTLTTPRGVATPLFGSQRAGGRPFSRSMASLCALSSLHRPALPPRRSAISRSAALASPRALISGAHATRSSLGRSSLWRSAFR
jgi:hypothetical protein